MSDFATAQVYLWDRFVGAISESPNGHVAFEYDPEFQGSGFEISPIHLPLSQTGIRTFPELRRNTTFLGLPGVFADSLPDAFGNQLIQRYFKEKGDPQDSLSPVQRLLYVGDRGMGALTYRPGMDRSRGTETALEVQDLVEQARRVVEGDTSTAIPEIMRVGSTVGGARAKALILWDRDRNRVRSGFARPRSGEEHWIIKFDGVTVDSGGQGARLSAGPGPWGRIEYVYSRMARKSGIQMEETHLLRDGDLAHFMTRRFDREGEGGATRLHLHTLGGLLHLDYNNQYTFSYEGYLDTIRRLGLSQAAINEAFRRMVFSVATVNFDDHLKNFSFLMSLQGEWALSPAYDVAYAENQAWTRQHQMSINGRFREIGKTDLLEVGRRFDVPRNGEVILDEVMSGIDSWEEESEGVDLAPGLIADFKDRFERF